jgi:hypothetical protein
VIRFVGPALVIFPLLGGAAIAATVGKAPLFNQTEDHAIVKVEEACGNGYFRDEYGNCPVSWRMHTKRMADTISTCRR